MKYKSFQIHKQCLTFDIFRLCRAFNVNSKIKLTLFTFTPLNALKNSILGIMFTFASCTFHNVFVQIYENYN